MTERDTKLEQRTQPTIAGEVRVSASPFFSFFNADNMEIMKQYPDKYFDLAIVDKINVILLLVYQSILLSLYQIKNI
jgi:hypothetical protein